MINIEPLSDVVLGQTPRQKLQQGWSPRCLTTPASLAKWGVLKTTAVQAGGFLEQENKELPDTLQERSHLELQTGDLLMTCAGPRARCGVPALVRRTRPRLMISGKMYRFTANPKKIDARFLELYLLSPVAQSQIDAMKTGISDSGLNLTKDRFLRLPVPVQPLEEQRRIVDILEDHLSRLDAATQYMDSATAGASKFETSCLNQLVREEEATAPLGELARSSGYGTSTRCQPDAPGVAVARIPNLVHGYLDMSDEKRVVDPRVDLSTLMLEPGDLLVVRTNGSRDLIGRTAVVQDGITASFASYLIRYQLDQEQVRPGWVHLMLRRPTARRRLEALAASSAGQYNLSLGKLYDVAVPIPSLDEQVRRLAAFHNRASDATAMVAAVEQESNRCARLRRSLLAVAFSGHLTGHRSDLDRAEEMAE